MPQALGPGLRRRLWGLIGPQKPLVQALLPDGSIVPMRAFQWPTRLFLLAATLLVSSFFLPYWSMTLQAPQYPDGLEVSVHLTHLGGDVAEVDELNHYLGLPPLSDGGQLERQLAPLAVLVMALLLAAATSTQGRRALLLSTPVLLFPIGFLLDLWLILYDFGHSIDPTSALGGAIDPFTPPILGHGQVGQFATDARLEAGFLLALASTALSVLALWLHRRAYKPAHDAMRRVEVPLAFREPDPAKGRGT